MTTDPTNQPSDTAPPESGQPDTPPEPAREATAPAPPTSPMSLPKVRVVIIDPWAHRRGEPRTFAALWLLFLFAATILSVGAVGIFGLVSTDVYRPAARVMLEAITVGIVILWPMVRLSQAAPDRPIKAMPLDAIIVLLPVQAVLWPQALAWMAGWPVAVVGAAAGLICGWGVLIAGIMALYFAVEWRAPSAAPVKANDKPRRDVLPRWAMMALIILLLGAGPIVFALRRAGPAAGPGVDLLMSSPLTGIYEVTRDRPWTGQPAAIDERHRVAVWLVWCAAAGVWAVAWLAAGSPRKVMAAAQGPA